MDNIFIYTHINLILEILLPIKKNRSNSIMLKLSKKHIAYLKVKWTFSSLLSNSFHRNCLKKIVYVGANPRKKHLRLS